jgi:hypothetical protein
MAPRSPASAAWPGSRTRRTGLGARPGSRHRLRTHGLPRPRLPWARPFRPLSGKPSQRVQPASVDDLPAAIDFDTGSLVLTTSGRINSGTVRGDEEPADRFLNLSFRI